MQDVEQMVDRLWAAGPLAGPDGSTLARLKMLTEEVLIFYYSFSVLVLAF